MVTPRALGVLDLVFQADWLGLSIIDRAHLWQALGRQGRARLDTERKIFEEESADANESYEQHYSEERDAQLHYQGRFVDSDGHRYSDSEDWDDGHWHIDSEDI